MAEDPEWIAPLSAEEAKGRKKTSSVWRYCDIIDNTFALCTICNHKLSYKSSVTNLRKHFKKRHPDIPMPPSMQYVRKNNLILEDTDDNRTETQRATNKVIVDYLRPAGDENRLRNTLRNSLNFAKYGHAVKRERSPDNDFRPNSKSSRTEETEFELFGRSIVMQLKQLPLVHALEVQGEITNLILQKRIQSLRHNHETSTEESGMQYALVYTTEPQGSEEGEEITAVAVEKAPENTTETE